MLLIAYKKILHLLSKKDKKDLIKIFAFLSIGMVLEFLGLGLIFPLLYLILDPTNSEITEKISAFGNYSDIININNMLIIVILIFLIKNIVLSLVSFFQNKLLYNIAASISHKIFTNYLNQPYIFFLERNSSDLIKIIQIEIPLFGSFCFNFLTIIVESLILFSIISIVIFIDPIGAISLCLFFSFTGFIFYSSTKKRLKLWGDKREQSDKKLSNITLTGLNAIKELKILNRTEFFTEKFHEQSFIRSDVYAKNNFISQMPRYYLEIVGITGLFGYIFIMLYLGKEVNTLMATLGFFFGSILRIIPSINKIINSFQTIKFNHSAVDSIYDEFTNFKINDSSNKNIINSFSELKIKNLNFKYQKNNNIFSNFNLTIQKGDRIGIIGSSGSGKSTLANIITCQLNPTSGSLLVDSKNIFSDPTGWLNLIGYVPQNPYLSNDTLKNNIAFGINENKIENKKIKQAIELSELSDLVFNLSNGIDTMIGERGIKLSGGQSQRIAIARAIYDDPELFIFDESTSALDEKTESKIIESIQNFSSKKTIIIISHRMSTLKYCNKILNINDL